MLILHEVPPPKVHVGNAIAASLAGPFAKRIKNIPLTPEAIAAKPPSTNYVTPKERLFLPIHGQRLTVDDDFSYFVASHPFKNLITKPDTEYITTSELTEILRKVKFELACYDTGAMPASTNPSSSYSKFAWTRDMANKTMSMIEAGCINEAKRIVYGMASFYNLPENRELIKKYVANKSSAKIAYRLGHYGHVPIRAQISSNGEMVNSNHPWAHNQLDAIGAWLYVTFYLANTLSDNSHQNHDQDFLKNLDHHLSTVNGDNSNESIFSLTFSMLHNIECWDNYDVGPWEDVYAHKRASSVGICLAAAKQAKQHLQVNNWNNIRISDTERFKHELQNLMHHSGLAIEDRIPRDGIRNAVECDEFKSDAALTFLLYPYNPGLDYSQELAILRTIYGHRLGTAGITRRDKDIYVGADYPYNIDGQGIYANEYVQDYKAAQWAIFDPLLACFFFKKFATNLKNGFMDSESFKLGQVHLKRSLSQVTKNSDVYLKRYYLKDPIDYKQLERESHECIYEELVKVSQFSCPEAYWYDNHFIDPNTHRKGKWRPNENSPLLWTEANFALMIKEAMIATHLMEEYIKTTDKNPLDTVPAHILN